MNILRKELRNLAKLTVFKLLESILPPKLICLFYQKDTTKKINKLERELFCFYFGERKKGDYPPLNILLILSHDGNSKSVAFLNSRSSP